jgi:hypothetical protein
VTELGTHQISVLGHKRLSLGILMYMGQCGMSPTRQAGCEKGAGSEPSHLVSSVGGVPPEESQEKVLGILKGTEVPPSGLRSGVEGQPGQWQSFCP